MRDEEEQKTKLYLKATILIFAMFFMILLCTVGAVGFILMIPASNGLFVGLGSVTIVILCAVYGVCALFGSSISYFIIKKVFGPLVDLSEKSKKVAKGDFSCKVNESSSIVELRETLHNFNLMVEELAKVEILSNDFVSNVSHEFKTPLAVIKNYVSIIETEELTEDERKKYFDIINESIDKLSELISNVLKICKLDNQNIKVENKTYRLDEQLRTCILEMSNLIEKKDIELDIDVDDCLITTDEGLLKQVWLNILSNAIKFTPERGKITITLKQTDDIVVSIKDNGIGMDDETRKRIFDRFFQGDQSHAKDGNGLGLPIVAKILKLLHGYIIVESKVNEGSNFIIKFKKTKVNEELI